MAFNQTLKVTQDPKIALKELFAADTKSASGQNPFYKGSDNTMGPEAAAGSDSPYVMINGAVVGDISYLEINEVDLIPKVKIIFKDVNGSLSGPNYPKNDPILSLYIKVSNEKLKPVRMDFLITSIKSDQDAILDAESMGSSAEFTMIGELFIPKIYNYKSKAYRGVGSKGALIQLASDLDLGFSENDSSTNDVMTWINPNRDGLYFIDHISRHAYLNEDTFFDCFIDKFFNLTFVNVPIQLVDGPELDLTPEQRPDSSELEVSREAKTKGSDKDPNESLAVLQLTNNPRFRGKTEYIQSYSLLGDVGSILKTKGYRRRIYYYDHILDDNKFTKFYVKPIGVKGMNEATQLIPANESLRGTMIHKWMNVDYGNTHREWNAASLINDHNKSELKKVKLKVETSGINLQVVRGSSIKVNMVNTRSSAKDKASGVTDKPKNFNGDNEGGDSASFVPDGLLTGRYYVAGVRYIYDPMEEFKFKTEFDLCRINWLSENIID
jgi:hypothetical protein